MIVIFSQASTTDMSAFWTWILAAVLVLFVLIHCSCAFEPELQCVPVCQQFLNETFKGHCPSAGSCDWQCAAERMNCSGGYVYHCARNYEDPDKFVHGCAVPKICKKGEEPAITFTIDTIQVPRTKAAVNCIKCVNKEYYNDKVEIDSSRYSQCSSMKLNKCTVDKHKIDCGVERQDLAWNEQTVGEGFCRCDARAGYAPTIKIDQKEDYCFTSNFICEKINCRPGEELSLNYQCIPQCPEGHRRNQMSDICVELKIASSAATNVSDLPTTTNRTESVTTSAISQSNTSGTSPQPANKDVVIAVGCIMVVIVFTILLVYYIWKRRETHKAKKTEEALRKEKGTSDEAKSLIETDRMNEAEAECKDTSLRQKVTYIKKVYKIEGDHYEIHDGKTYIKQNDNKLSHTTNKDSGVKKQSGSRDDSSNNLQATQVPLERLSSSEESLSSFSSAAGSLPSPPVYSKEGQHFRSDVLTEIRKSVVTQPSDEHEQDSNVLHVKLPLLTPTMKQEEGHKPEDITQGPDFDVDVGVDAAEHALSCQEMDNLAREMLNWLNEYLSISMGYTDTDFAKIKANLEKMAADKNVNLDEMLNFPERVVKPLERWKEIFICKNCRKEFIVGNSSGKYKKCLYQSVSLLLCGEEHLQNQLCLCSLLHAVKWFKDYVKQLEACVGREKSPWLLVQQILLPADIQTDHADWQLCLREGIRQIVVQTSESTTDSCELHIMFLSHALGRKITLHCQDSHRLDREECPVLPQYLHEGTKQEKQENLEDLHILWRPEHFMPLFER